MRDYDELIKDLREYAELVDHDMWDCPYMIADSMKQAADAIEDLIFLLTASNEVVANRRPKWISVEDALPEEDVEVLISYRYKEGEGDTSHVDIDITTYGQMYFGGREVAGVKHWRPPFEYFSSNYEVIAWMPLPSTEGLNEA